MHHPRHIVNSKHRRQKQSEEESSRRKQKHGKKCDGEKSFEYEEVSLNETVSEEVACGGEPGSFSPAHENLRRRRGRRASKDGLRDVWQIRQNK